MHNLCNYFWMPFMKLLNIIYTFVITILLFGCGGGGGTSAIPDESADGIWVGFSFKQQGDRSDIIALFHEGNYATINTTSKELYSGSYTIDKDIISSQDSKSYSWDGSLLASGSASGTVNSQSTIMSTFTADASNSDVNNPQLRDDSIMYERKSYEKKLNNTLLNGSWTTQKPYESSSEDEPLYVFAIQNGKLSVVNSINCFIDGELNIPNKKFNIFEFTFKISGSVCNFNGDYSGLGFLKTLWVEKDDGTDEEADVLTFAYSNDDFGFVFETYRLSP